MSEIYEIPTGANISDISVDGRFYLEVPVTVTRIGHEIYAGAVRANNSTQGLAKVSMKLISFRRFIKPD